MNEKIKKDIAEDKSNLRKKVRNLGLCIKKYRVIPLVVITFCFIVSFIIVKVWAASYGTTLGNFNGVTVYSNGNANYASYDDSYVGGVRIGMKWQCVEYVRRYYYTQYGLDLRSKWVGNAKTFWDADPAARMGLTRYANGGSTAPLIGDMIVSQSGMYGHIAIIRSVSSNQVRVAQQNFTEETSDADYPLTLTVSNGNYTVGGFSSGYTVAGWLRRQGAAPATCQAGSSESFRINGYPPVHPNGTLIKLVNDPTFYLIRGGQKQGITSQSVLEYLYDNGGFRFEDVITVAQDEFNSYSTGAAISETLPSNGKPKPDGTLIKKANGEISIISDNGGRRPFGTYQMFLDLGYKDCNVTTVSDAEYNSYPTLNLVNAMPKLTASMRLYNIGSVGQEIRGEFTITNIGNSTYTFNKLLISGRLNNNTIADFPYVSSITLAPGQPYTYVKTFTPSSAGSYRFFVAYEESNGQFTTSVPNYNGAINSETITINIPTTIPITVQTSPSGRSFSVDGTNYTSSQTFNWTSGSNHTIATNSPQTGGSGTQYVWNNWSDNGAMSHTVSPTTATTYTANFMTQYQLTMNAGTGGTVSPPSGNWYNAGQSVPISATPNGSYIFSNWTGTGNGSYNGTNTSTNITINSPISQTANFTQCTYSINPTNYNSAAGGSSGTVNVMTSNGCAWTANSNTSWITLVSGSSGNGNGTVNFSVAANSSTSPRTGAITVAGQTLTVTQNGLNCGTSVINPSSQDFTASGGNSSFGIFMNSGCPWTAISNAQWLTITANSNGNGNGTINFSVAANTGTQSRSANISVGGQNFIVNQSGNTSTTIRKSFDFDGDGKSDISVFRPSNGAWYLLQSANGFTGTNFGLSTDKLVPADYDGDGKTDIAVYRNGNWYLQRSQTGFTGIAFGDSNDIPVPADYDGDGKADIAVFRPSNGTWYLLRSQAGFTGLAFGQNGDKPVAADYDGDGKADVAVNRNGIWYIQRSQLGFTGIQFGDGNDKSVPADYDGDGKTDIAVFRPSNGVWYLLQSSAGFTGIGFGLGTDLPVPADYDGDGKADIAVFRNGNWYLQRSSQGFTGVAFGAADDKPIPNTFVP